MNCQRFETVVSELARGQMMAAEQRSEALAHSDECYDCAARLGDEQMLTLGLQSLATEMDSLEAPREVEAKLLEAFRAREVVVPITKRSSASYWLAAIAAMLLIAISVVVFRWSSRPADEPRQVVKQEQPQPKPDVSNESNEQLAQGIEKPAVMDPTPQLPKPKRIRPVNSRRPDSASVANHATKEIATDFIPLSYMSAASLQQEGGQIIRVQLPRSALANFGLPVNMDRYNEKVKADVLYGVDGMARAIRFVQ
ncbi:MAG TPA: hypothetical protein VKB05_01100 [Pyrinomonadaceae bacterium]|nr:hypothetical protein [Pyrinomonadaceae bacterium]